MTDALVELSFHKVGPIVMIFRKSDGYSVGSIERDPKRGIIFLTSQFCNGLSMVELGIIRAKMDDIEAGW